MARIARLLVHGAAYHVTARGNRRQQIFFGEDDYDWYLNRLSSKSAASGLELLGWCLMPNHVHLLVREQGESSMASTIGSVHSAYATRVNGKRAEDSGHLWQGRYYSAPLPEDRVWTVLRYIELNPVRAGLIKNAAHFPWSTAQYRAGGVLPPKCLSMRDWSGHWNSAEWAEALTTGIEEAEEVLIRQATKLGKWPPYGNGAGL